MRQKPTVLAREIVASSRLFRVEELQLRFSNGVERTYERLVGKGAGYGAVMVVAMLDAEHAVLVEEYCGGTDDYQLSLPKGLIEPGEDVLVAANRELKEEAGIDVRNVRYICSQPWPFPNSLMIGAWAEAVDDSLTIDRTELDDARWFTREEVVAALNNDQDAAFQPPPPTAIARTLLERWVDGLK